ncbi:MAG: DNA-binding response regulator [Anaerolineae bacterium CG2_30_64_16]|nr:MAG: DNA-binding response regulator [Anaerolineae bacterium CG2_30_64_16]
MQRIHVLLADDHAVLRAGLRALLSNQPNIEVVAEAGDGYEAVRLAETLAPDIVLMDISMPGMDGLAATRLMRQRCPNARVIVLTMHEEESFLRQVLAAGGAGYVLKKAAEGELLAAIRVVHRGEAFVDPAMTRTMIEGYLGGEAPAPNTPNGVELSPRETEVITLIAQGYTNQQIAARLVISVKTVETHKANIMQKLGAKSRVELVRYALETGLLKPA